MSKSASKRKAQIRASYERIIEQYETDEVLKKMAKVEEDFTAEHELHVKPVFGCLDCILKAFGREVP